MLELRDVSTSYGDARVLFSVSLSVSEGEAVGIVGRNGSGKTTTFKTVMGLLPLDAGEVWFNGTRIDGRDTYRISRLGIALVPEDRRLFPNMTVRENLLMGAEASGATSNAAERIREVLEVFPPLGPLLQRSAGFLSGGEQQMVSIGRALMSGPQMLLLDEPAEGLAPAIVRELRDRLVLLKERGVTLLISEQNVHFLSAVTDNCYVLDKGEVKHTGPTTALWDNTELLKRYLAV